MLKSIVVHLTVALCSAVAVDDNEEEGPSRSREPKPVRACFLNVDALRREGDARFVPAQHHSPGLCTHLLFERVTFDAQFRIIEPYGFADALRAIRAMEADRNSSLQVLISIGGHEFTSRTDRFGPMTQSEPNRREFIRLLAEFVGRHQLDGVDIDWQLWTDPHKNDNSKHQLMALFKELRMAATDEGRRLSNGSSALSGKLVTATVCAVPYFAGESYFRDPLKQAVDFVWLLSHDFHGSWDSHTGLHAPLEAYEDERMDLSVKSGVQHWLGDDVQHSRHKVVVGISTFARTWTLFDRETSNGVGARASIGAESILGESGIAAHYEICEILLDCDVESRYDPQPIVFARSKMPYLIFGDQWCSYEDRDSVQAKLDWMASARLFNVAIRYLDADDFRGECSGSPYPLTATVAQWHDRLFGTKNSPSTFTGRRNLAFGAQWRDHRMLRVLLCRKYLLAGMILLLLLLISLISVLVIKLVNKIRTLLLTELDFLAELVEVGDTGTWEEWDAVHLVTVCKIGEGSFGKCFKMKHRRFARMLAKKVIDTQRSLVLGGEMNELQLLSEINCLKQSSEREGAQHIVDFYGGYEDMTRIVIYTELMDLSLERIVTREPIAEEFIARIMLAMVAAVEFLWNAHPDKHFLHRDIKPSNILANREGAVKLCDFGVSRALSGTVTCTALKGSYGYMAPEVEDGGRYSVQADLFSLGRTLLRLATLHRRNGQTPALPFLAVNTIQQKAYNSLQSDLEALTPRYWDYSEQFEQFLGQCLQRDPADRCTLEQLVQSPFHSIHAQQWDSSTGKGAFCEWIRAQIKATAKRKPSWTQ